MVRTTLSCGGGGEDEGRRGRVQEHATGGLRAVEPAPKYTPAVWAGPCESARSMGTNASVSAKLLFVTGRRSPSVLNFLFCFDRLANQ